MFDNNWNILIVVFVLVLIFAYFCNNYEGFAGTVDVKNAEALALVSSVYNKDNMTVTNLTATSTITLPGTNKITLNAADGNKITVDAPAGKAPFYINNGIDMGCWNNWTIMNDGRAKFGNLNVTGGLNVTGATTMAGITSPTIDWLHNRIAALENDTVQYKHSFWIRAGDRNMYSDPNRTWLGPGNDGSWWKLQKMS